MDNVGEGGQEMALTMPQRSTVQDGGPDSTQGTKSATNSTEMNSLPPSFFEKENDPHSPASAVHLATPRRVGLEERFAPTDPPRSWDLAAHPRVARILHNRKFQFFLILPNQIIFWGVIFLGLLGTVIPGLNFATAITWYIWFCLVFVLMVVVGRGWCSMCPFGGFAEWLQRKAFWRRTQKALGLGKKLPEPIAKWGLMLSIVTFVGLTWIEEFFNIAGPGTPSDTSWMVIGIVSSAVLFFLVFERRTFCRYFCPLSALIGTVGATGSVAGFRTRDREVCLSCETKECMRGGVEGYGCPWYTWPGSADANLTCGLCSECYKGCPSENVGLYLQPPLTSVVAPKRRRADVAWAVMALWGLVLFQQVNATNGYTDLDNWLNKVTGFAHYPNPIDYVGIIVILALATAAVYKVASRWVMRDPGPDQSRSFVDRKSRFRSLFVPSAYGLIPLVGADYFARQLPKFFKHSTRIVPSIGSWFGAGSTHSSLYHYHILSNPNIVISQVVVMGLGTAASIWATHRIVRRDIAPNATRPLAAMAVAIGAIFACGVAAGFLYVIMHAAS
jgi:NosR/NirI family nitrous oxide reductase transcriptional regulator